MAYVIFGGLLAPMAAGAQPTDLSACLSGSGGYLCGEEARGPSSFDWECDRTFFTYAGRVTWAPLRCAGPITIEVETLSHPLWTRYPIYVEILPVPVAPCPQRGPGVTVMTVHGRDGPCGYWETAGPIDITSLVPVGSLYAVQLVFFFGGIGTFASPAADCIRITSHPIVPVAEASWGMVKNLYRDPRD